MALTRKELEDFFRSPLVLIHEDSGSQTVFKEGDKLTLDLEHFTVSLSRMSEQGESRILFRKDRRVPDNKLLLQGGEYEILMLDYLRLLSAALGVQCNVLAYVPGKKLLVRLVSLVSQGDAT